MRTGQAACLIGHDEGIGVDGGNDAGAAVRVVIEEAHVVAIGINPHTGIGAQSILVTFNLHNAVIEARGEDAGVLARRSHAEHTSGDIVSIAVGK